MMSDDPTPIPLRRAQPTAARARAHASMPAKVQSAFADYRDMGDGRTLEELARTYQSASGAGLKTPPTTRVATLKEWSARYDWQGRLAGEALRRDALTRQAADQAAAKKEIERVRRLETTGDACLTLATAILRRFVIQSGPQAGQLNPQMVDRVSPRDLAPMIKAGVECMQLAAGAPTAITQVITPAELQQMVAEMSEAERIALVKGLRVLRDARQRRQGVLVGANAGASADGDTDA